MAGMNSNLGPAVGTKLRQSSSMPSSYLGQPITTRSIVKQTPGTGGGGSSGTYSQGQEGGGGGGGSSPGMLACPPTMPWWILLLAAAGTIETLALIGFHR